MQAFDLYGAGTKSRTRDLLITSQLLYQLSYAGTPVRWSAFYGTKFDSAIALRDFF